MTSILSLSRYLFLYLFCSVTARAFLSQPTSRGAFRSSLPSFARMDKRSHFNNYKFALSSSLIGDDGERRRRMAEFLNLEPLEEPEVRRARKKRDSLARAQFARYGDELWELRDAMKDLTEELVEAVQRGLSGSERAILEHLRSVERRDPELVYKAELEEMIKADDEGRTEDVEKHKKAAMEARSCLPQFNLEGLWVGKYGSHGYEMINVTYAGDLLVAFKVTGDKNVPRGEITFQADLSPLRGKLHSREQPLEPICLTDKASKKWGTKKLPRFHGLGQVAEEDFQNHQWMDGQLILIGEEYFSFAWTPIEHQIFFGRPSPELALKMLRDGGVFTLKNKTWDSPPSVNDDPSVLKDYAAYCFEVTTQSIEEDLKGNEFGCIWHGMDTEECYFE